MKDLKEIFQRVLASFLGKVLFEAVKWLYTRGSE